jgi:hypothetical protein
MRDITFIILLLRSMLTNKILTIGLLGLFFAQQQQYCLKHLRIDTATDGGVQPELEAAVVQQPAVELTVSSRLPLVDLPTAHRYSDGWGSTAGIGGCSSSATSSGTDGIFQAPFGEFANGGNGGNANGGSAHCGGGNSGTVTC